MADAVIAELEPLQVRHEELVADQTELARLLDTGAHRARETTDPVLAHARRAMGITR